MLLQFKFDPDKPFVIPFAEYLHKGKDAIQIINEASAAAFAADLLSAKANGAPGLPIYQGHPDVPELASKYPNKAAIGWITKITATADSVELQPEWISQPKPGEFIYFSPYFFSDATTSRRKIIDEIKSIALTNTPNDTRFRLPNEAATNSTGLTCQALTQKGETTMDKLILESLGLEEGASVEQAVAKIKSLSGTANEEADLKKEVEDKAAEVAAAKAEADKAKEEFANERTERVKLMLDNALSDGRISAAARPNWEKRLGNRESFANEAASLSREKPGFKTRSAFANERGPDEREGFANEAACLAHYESMPAGQQKRDFLSKNAEAINNARNQRTD